MPHMCTSYIKKAFGSKKLALLQLKIIIMMKQKHFMNGYLIFFFYHKNWNGLLWPSSDNLGNQKIDKLLIESGF